MSNKVWAISASLSNKNRLARELRDNPYYALYLGMIQQAILDAEGGNLEAITWLILNMESLQEDAFLQDYAAQFVVKLRGIVSRIRSGELKPDYRLRFLESEGGTLSKEVLKNAIAEALKG